MKVLIVSPKFHPVIGGGETFIFHASKKLYKAGIDISIAAEPNPLRRLDAYPFPVHEISGLSDTNLDVISAPDGLFNLITKERPDVIHVHGYFGLLAVALSNSKNIPIVASIHSTPVWGTRIIGGMNGFDQELVFAKQVMALAKPKIVTAANEVYATAARQIISGSTKVKIMPYPLLPEYFRKYNGYKWREKFSLKDTDKLIMLPSRIIERKGIREAVYALTRLPDNFFLCLPCASTPLDKDYWLSITKSKEFKLVKNRLLIPEANIVPEDMPYLFAASDIVAMPSYYEGAPVATIEAMACKRPFVGTDCQGISSFIQHEQNGLLVPVKNIDKLAQAILALSHNTDMRDKFVNNAAKSVASLSWKHQLPNLTEIYRQAIKND